jgi:hypothetical protein
MSAGGVEEWWCFTVKLGFAALEGLARPEPVRENLK